MVTHEVLKDYIQNSTKDVLIIKPEDVVIYVNHVVYDRFQRGISFLTLHSARAIVAVDRTRTGPCTGNILPGNEKPAFEPPASAAGLPNVRTRLLDADGQEIRTYPRGAPVAARVSELFRAGEANSFTLAQCRQ